MATTAIPSTAESTTTIGDGAEEVAGGGWRAPPRRGPPRRRRAPSTTSSPASATALPLDGAEELAARRGGGARGRPAPRRWPSSAGSLAVAHPLLAVLADRRRRSGRARRGGLAVQVELAVVGPRRARRSPAPHRARRSTSRRSWTSRRSAVAGGLAVLLAVLAVDVEAELVGIAVEAVAPSSRRRARRGHGRACDPAVVESPRRPSSA